MTVIEFVDRYNDIKTENGKKDLIRSIVLKDRKLTFVQRKLKAESIASGSCVDPQTKQYKVDSITTAFLYTIVLLQEYTTLELSLNKVGDYDLLESNGLLMKIIEMIDESERRQLDIFTKLAVEDYKENHGDFVSRLADVFNSFSNVLTDMVNKLPEDEKNKIMEMFKERASE